MADANAPKLIPGTFTVRNTSPGPRGFHDHESGYVDVEPGATVSGVRFTEAEAKSIEATGYFEITSGDAPAPEPEQDDGQANDGPKAYADVTAKDLKAHLDAAGVTYETDANKQALYDLYAASFEPPAPPPVTPAPDDELDKASDADLRDIAVALVGADKVPDDADREQLLKLARGEAE